MKALLSVFQGSRLGASARRVLEITQIHIHIHTYTFTPGGLGALRSAGAALKGSRLYEYDLHGIVHGRL